MSEGIKVLKNKEIYKGKIYECFVELSQNIWTKHVAKITTFDDECERKFILNVYQELQKLRHKNIVEILKLSESKDDLTIVMRKYDCNLDEYINTCNFEGNYNERFLFVLNFLDQILEGYEFFYKYQIAHRDIKPKNILIKFTNNKPQYFLADLESVKAYQNNVPLNSDKVTEWYAAPEVFEHFKPQNLNEFIAQDIYSIGLTFYKFLYKKEPFQTKKERKEYFIQKQQGKFHPKDEYQVFIEQMMRIDPKARITFENLKKEVKRIIKQNQKEITNHSYSPNQRQQGVNDQNNMNYTAREYKQNPQNITQIGHLRKNNDQYQVEVPKLEQKGFSPITKVKMNDNGCQIQKPKPNNQSPLINRGQLQNQQNQSPLINRGQLQNQQNQNPLHNPVAPNYQQVNQNQFQVRNQFRLNLPHRQTPSFLQAQCNRGISPINW